MLDTNIIAELFRIRVFYIIEPFVYGRFIKPNSGLSLLLLEKPVFSCRPTVVQCYVFPRNVFYV